MGTLASLLLNVLALGSIAIAQEICNGRAEYCSRRYSELSFAASHNAMFVGELPTQNQHLSIEEQLRMGIRYIQGQTQNNFLGELRFCHTDCALEDAGPIVDTFRSIRTWLDQNPDEVVTLLIANGDNNDMSEYDGAFVEAGLRDMAFVPSTSPEVLPMEEWPTLRELIASGRRLVVFIDNGADMGRFDYILDEFSYYFETPFSPVAFDSCAVHRPPNSGPEGKMYILNHNLNVELFDWDILVPDKSRIDQTNAPTGPGSIGEHVDMCRALYNGRVPNAVILDFVDRGDPMAAERNLNGV